jgi:excinuclease UvrABC ATPase subunit
MTEALGLEAADFSFNSRGACAACGGSGFALDGFGEETESRCHPCGGSRLAGPSWLIRSDKWSLVDLLEIPAATLLQVEPPAFDHASRETLKTLLELGLGHLALGRATATLSTGERQRLGLARFLARLEGDSRGGLLVLDEPTAGLSVPDAQQVFTRLRTMAQETSHTAIVIEHKLELLQLADWVVEFGPGGGPEGGRVVFEGTPADLKKAKTPTARAWNSRWSASKTSPFAQRSRSEDGPLMWDRCADIFERFATRLETHDEADVAPPIRPAVRLAAERIPKDARVGELLDLLPWAVRNRVACVPTGAIGVDSRKLAEGVHGCAFAFSPVAPQLRLGLATAQDLQNAVKSLAKLGFHQAGISGKECLLRELPQKASTMAELSACEVICPADATEPLRETALRWSQGVVRLYSGNRAGIVLTTQFLSDSGIIGLELDASFVGDCRSPQGRCPQCLGTGQLPTYPLHLIVADERRGIADDGFWRPEVLKAIRSLRRSRLLPEAEFFAKCSVADFRQPLAKMDPRTRILFEHGIPWRHFPKPSRDRTDRQQDYYAWRGLHDYVYLVLGRIAPEDYKQRLKQGFRYIECPACDGTGMGWESSWLELSARKLRRAWRDLTLSEWRAVLGCDIESLGAALTTGLGDLRANDRFEALPQNIKDRLLVALAVTAPLWGLALVASPALAGEPEAKRIVKGLGMAIIPAPEANAEPA